MNALGKDLKFKVVIFSKEILEVEPTEHPFLVENGFGASSFTGGDALIGVFLSDGEKTRMEGYGVERFATEEEILAAKQHEEILASHNIGVEDVIGSNDDEYRDVEFQ